MMHKTLTSIFFYQYHLIQYFYYKRCNHKIMTHTQLLCVSLKSKGIAIQDDMRKLNGRIQKKIGIIFYKSTKNIMT